MTVKGYIICISKLARFQSAMTCDVCRSPNISYKILSGRGLKIQKHNNNVSIIIDLSSSEYIYAYAHVQRIC